MQLTHSLKAPGCNPRAYEVRNRFQILLSNATLYRYAERFSLVIRALLTQEGICMTLQPDFRFLEVAYPYVVRSGFMSTHTHTHTH
jgi:predicted unusual protein kinase regulating ubiquinone biosynthesis (AarF/ABC1/UbiB family)